MRLPPIYQWLRSHHHVNARWSLHHSCPKPLRFLLQKSVEYQLNRNHSQLIHVVVVESLQSKWIKFNLLCSERRQLHLSTEKRSSSQTTTTRKIDSWVKMFSLPCPRRTTCWSLVASENICPVNPPDACGGYNDENTSWWGAAFKPPTTCIESDGCPLTIQQYKVSAKKQ